MAKNPFLRTSSDQFLSKRHDSDPDADDAVWAWLSPPHPGEERVKFLVTKEDGDVVSILPGQEGRFKTGLRAWRWKEEEGGEHEVYAVVKTKHNRIDLRRMPN
jgi:hypothetical protein